MHESLDNVSLKKFGICYMSREDGIDKFATCILFLHCSEQHFITAEEIGQVGIDEGRRNKSVPPSYQFISKN